MSSKKLVGKCGLFCGACSIYRAERDSEEWRKRIAAKSDCSPDKVRCNGCGDLTSECWGKGCKIVLCTQTRRYNFCYECPEYESNSCSKYNSLYKRYLTTGVDLRENSSRIKKVKLMSGYYNLKNYLNVKSVVNLYLLGQVNVITVEVI